MAVEAHVEKEIGRHAEAHFGGVQCVDDIAAAAGGRREVRTLSRRGADVTVIAGRDFVIVGEFLADVVLTAAALRRAAVEHAAYDARLETGARVAGRGTEVEAVAALIGAELRRHA